MKVTYLYTIEWILKIVLVVLLISTSVFAQSEKKSDNDTNVATLQKVFVKQIQLTGNTVFSEKDLSVITSAYENREITFEELMELRQKLTMHYVEKGYINSGAVIPDQKVENGIIQIQIIEGKLTYIDIEEIGRLTKRYIKSRLALGQGPPLNINELQKQVQLLHQDPVVKRINAELSPGIGLGESVLKVQVTEDKAWTVGFRFANNRSPSIGSERGEIYAMHRNVTGWGDTLGVSYGITEGLNDYSVYYWVPLTARELTLKLRYDKNNSEVVESPFSDIDIEGESESYSVTLSHPLYKKPGHELNLSLTGEKRHSETSLLSKKFSFSPGADHGESDVSVIRFSQDWLLRESDYVLAARSTFSFGIDALDATINDEGPDGEFFAWLGQFQFAKRFDKLLKTQVIFKTDVQWTNDPLLSLEKFSVGGATSVRGYRENQLVRDRGVVSSLEFRIPVYKLPIPKISKSTDDGLLQAAIFGDTGWAENKDEDLPGPSTLSSVGLGLRYDPSTSIHAHIYWGYGFRSVDDEQNEYDIQDDGIHFQMAVSY